MKILIVLCLFLVGCASAPKTPLPEPIKLERYEYTDIQPVSTPKPFLYPVEAYTDEAGIEWVKVRSEDANSLLIAFQSAEGNADLVKHLNDLNRLNVDRANALRELIELEEHSRRRLMLRLQEERELNEQNLKQLRYDVWMWRIAALLGLAVGL